MEQIAQLGIKVDSTDIKKATNELNNLSSQSGKTEKTTNNLIAGFSKIQAGAIAAAAGITAMAKAGVDYNAQMEKLTNGLTTLNVLTSKNVDSNGKALSQEQKYNLARLESIETMKKLNAINLETPHTLDQTVQIYKSMYTSMKTVGVSSEEMIDLTKKLSIAAGSSGIEFQQLLAGIDGLATGTVEASSELGRFLKSMGLGNEVLKNSTNIYETLNNKFKDVKGIMGYDEAVSNLTNSFDQLTGALVAPFFDDVKDGITGLSGMFNELTNAVTLFYDKFKSISELTSKEQLNKRAVEVSERIQQIQEDLKDPSWFQSSGKLNAELRAANLELLAINQSFVDMDKSSQSTLVATDKVTEVKDETKKLTNTINDNSKAIQDNNLYLEALNDAYAEIAQVGLSQYDSTLVSIAEKTQKWIEAGVKENDVLAVQKQLIDELNIQQALSSASEELSFLEKKAQLMTDEYEKSKLLLEIKYAQSLIDIQGSDKPLEDKQNLIDKETELYNLTLQRIELDRNTEFQETISGFYDDMLDSQMNLNSAVYDFGSGFGGVASKIGAVSKAIAAMSNLELQSKKEATSLDKKYIEQFNRYAGDSAAEIRMTAELEQQYTKDTALLKEQNLQAQIAGYGQVAGAMSAMFEEGSKEAAAFQMVESGLAVVAGIRAILTQGSGDPYSAFARMAVMAASVASLLSSADIAFGGIRGGDSSSSGKELTANTGTGTVLGDTTAQSESMQKSLEILEEYKKPEFQVLQSMNKYLAGILDSLGGVSSLIVQRGGKSFGAGYVDSYSSKTRGQIGDISKLHTIGAIADPLMGLPLLLSKAIGGSDTFNSVMDVLSGKKLTNKLTAGLFGKTSSWTDLKGYGISFGNQLLKDAINEVFGSEYQTIKTTTKTSSWFKGTNESSSTKTKYYDMAGFTETERQFSLILDNMYNSVYEAGILLGENSDTLISNLDNFVVKLGNISFKGKSAAQIQKDLESVFGAVGDRIAKNAIPELKEFQNIGEGTFETLTRVATGMEVAGYYAERLGTSFEKIDFMAIENKQGDIGFEALLQSIEQFDESLYGVDNNLMLIVENMDGTAEELYGIYDSLSNLRDMLAYLKLDTDAVSYATIRGAGSAEALSEAMSSYFENFLTDTQKVEFTTQQLRKEFTELNMVMPETKEGFTNLIESIDLSTESGQELYGRLIILSDGFSSLNESIIESQANVVSFVNSFKTEDLLTQDLAKSLGIPLATTYDELALTFSNLLSDGLTDAELEFLNVNKSQIESLQNKVLEDEKELAQTRLDNTKKELDLVKSSISTIESITSNLKSTIEKLRDSADSTSKYTLNKFYESMTKTQELLKGNDYEAITKSIQETIGYSSALSDSKNFTLSRDMQYAQLVAANQFEAMDLTLNDELDYLKLIEENTANTVDTLTETLKVLGDSISGSINNNTNTIAEQMEKAAAEAKAKQELESKKMQLESQISNSQAQLVSYQAQLGTAMTTKDEDTWTSQFLADAMAYQEKLVGGNTWITTKGSGYMWDAFEELRVELALQGHITKTELKDVVIPYIQKQIDTQALITKLNADILASKSTIATLQSEMLNLSTGVSTSTVIAPVVLPVSQSPTIPTSGNILTKVQSIFGALANFPKFDVGTTNIPSDMLAQIHKGEIITPANFSHGLRNGDLIMGETSSIISAINNMSLNLSNRVTNLEIGLNGIISNQSSQIKIMNDTYDVNNGTLVSLQTIEKVI